MPYSIALSSYRVEVSTVFVKQDVTAADWLSEIAGDYPVYVDHHSSKLQGVYLKPSCEVRQFPRDASGISSPSYIYLRTWNTQKRVLTFATAYAARQSVSFDDLPWFVQAMEKSDRIYNNGGAEILLHRRNGATTK